MLDRLQRSFERVCAFSDDIAHELRTPLSVIRGQMEVTLSAPRSTDEYREVIGSSLEELVSLSDLVHRLLFLTRLENEAVAADFRPIDVVAELEEVKEFYEPVAGEAEVVLDVVLGPAVQVAADRLLFQRAIGNLVANAIRHTPPGGTVTLAAVEAADSAKISVKDTGHGIPPEHIPQVFGRFHRVEQARPSGGDHLGLGLAIVKGIVDLHRGDVEVTSAVGIGTCVTIRLPLAAADDPVAGAHHRRQDILTSDGNESGLN